MASDQGQWIVLVTSICAFLLVTNSIFVFILNGFFFHAEVLVESLHLFVFPTEMLKKHNFLVSQVNFKYQILILILGVTVVIVVCLLFSSLDRENITTVAKSNLSFTKTSPVFYCFHFCLGECATCQGISSQSSVFSPRLGCFFYQWRKQPLCVFLLTWVNSFTDHKGNWKDWLGENMLAYW